MVDFAVAPMSYTAPSAHSFTILPTVTYVSEDLLDPSLLRAARLIYQTYYETQQELSRRPTGVAVSAETGRGKPIFTPKPVLLPGELFVPIGQIESELY